MNKGTYTDPDKAQRERKSTLQSELKEVYNKLAKLADGSGNHSGEMSHLRTRAKMLEEEIAQIDGVLARAS